ncbi:MAG: histidine phosphatase family protein [Dehalococcoidia bacterium]
MAKWYLVRHGETEWNADGRFQGQTDVPVHDGGRKAAALTGQRLAGVAFAAAYASDLRRARETAEIVLAAQPPAQAPAPRFDPALREIAYGVFEGLTWEQIQRSDPVMADRHVLRDLDFAPEGGESFRGLLTRTDAFVHRVKADHPSHDILVVGHGGSLRALAVSALGLPYDAVWNLRGLEPASISVITHEDGTPALTAWNDVGHLS